LTPAAATQTRAQPLAGPRPDVLSKYSGRSVVAIGAHPDDLELGIGGVLARLSSAGARVIMAIVSVPNHLELRKEEATRGAKVLGAELRILNPSQCCRVEDLKNHQIVSQLDGLVKEFAPEAVFTHCYANLHLDHKIVHEACLSSQRLRFFDLFCYEPTSSYATPGTQAATGAFKPHAYVDISPVIDVKMEAIQSHATQFANRGLPTDHYREASGRVGQVVGVPFAESLEIVRMRLN